MTRKIKNHFDSPDKAGQVVPPKREVMRWIAALGVVCMLLFAVVSCESSKEPPATDEVEELQEAQFEATDHFWFDGERIPLQRMDNKFHIVFFSEDINKLKSELVNTGAVLSNVEVSYEENISSDRHATSEIKTATIEGYYNQTASALSHTIHWAPYFRMEDGREVWIINLFYVELKSKADLPLLKRLAGEHAVEVIGELSFLPGWYTLAATLLSTGNALEMANLFYETGLFESSSPSLIGLGQVGI